MKRLLPLAIAAIVAGCNSTPPPGPVSAAAQQDPRTSQDLAAAKTFLDQLEAQPPAQRAAFLAAHQKEASALPVGIPEVQKRLQDLLAQK